MKYFFSLVVSFMFYVSGIAQCFQPVNMQLESSAPATNTLTQHDMTARRDTAASKPYLYVAGKAQGLVIFNINNISSPVLTASVVPSALLNLHVMSLTQAGNYLCLALGDHFNSGAQPSGLAIIDITSPALPIVKSVYSYSLNSGAGHVAVEGNYAYLSAMQNGIMVFDISDKSNTQLVSVFKPSIHFPKVNPNSSEQDKINVRQIIAKNNILYVCYDAGGVRVVNATNKTNLVETGQYSNPVLNPRPRAYNNLVLHDSLVYVAADYCGMEILNIKDTSNITQIGWWNPWNCHNTSNTWFNSPGHANEIEFDENCKLVFLSTGRSDLHVVNVSNPANPDSCTRFGNTTDSLATWGLGRYQNQIYLAYISTWPWYIPFPGKWSGVKILTYDSNCATGVNELKQDEFFELFPNPSKEEVNVKIRLLGNKNIIQVYNQIGEMVMSENITKTDFILNLSILPSGIYDVKIMTERSVLVKKMVKL